MSIKVQSVDLVGTVVSHGADPSDEGHNPYLIVQLDNGETVRVRSAGSLDYRPRRRGVVREVTTNFFGLKNMNSRVISTSRAVSNCVDSR